MAAAWGDQGIASVRLMSSTDCPVLPPSQDLTPVCVCAQLAQQRLSPLNTIPAPADASLVSPALAHPACLLPLAPTRHPPLLPCLPQLARNMSLGITPAAGLGGLNDVPGGVLAPGQLPTTTTGNTTAGNTTSLLPGVMASPVVSPNVTAASDTSPAPMNVVASPSPTEGNSTTATAASPSPVEGGNSGIAASPAPTDGGNTFEGAAASPAPTGEGDSMNAEVAASPAPGARRLRGHLW